MARADEATIDGRLAAIPPPPSAAWPDDNSSLLTEPDDLEGSDEPSLMADLDALVGDAKTYLEAEFAYQKSRAGFTANRLKWSVAYGAAAFALLHLALIALTVGLVFALSPITGPWIATGIVVALLLVGALVFTLRLRKKLGDMRGVFEDKVP